MHFGAVRSDKERLDK